MNMLLSKSSKCHEEIKWTNSDWMGGEQLRWTLLFAFVGLAWTSLPLWPFGFLDFILSRIWY